MIQVNELHQKVAKDAESPIIVFNGELDRIRSGYYPSLLYPRLGKLAKNFLPQFESAYYIHNFKGSVPGECFLLSSHLMTSQQWSTVTSLCKDCFGTQEICPYIALSLLRGAAAVRMP